MKKALLFPVILILFTMSLKSQDPEFEYYKSKEIKTLLGRNTPGGSFGSVSIGYSIIDHKNAVQIGARVSGIASHFIGIGIGATGFLNEYSYEASINRQAHLSGGYGGVYIEPIFLPRIPVHLSFPVLFGAGWVSSVSSETDSHKSNIEDTRAFLLVEPSAELELNLTKHFRLAFGGSYRLPTGFNLGRSSTPSANVESLKGFSYRIAFKFGKF
jgi:hypothetical protein